MEGNNSIISGNKWMVLVVCFIATTVITIPYYGHSTQTITLMEKFGLNYTEMGVLDSATALSAGIVMLFGGMITYRWGARNMSILGLFIAIIGEVAMAFSTGYFVMVICRVIQGAGVGLVFLGPYAMVIRWFENTKNLGLALGVMIACDGAGAILALYIFAFILSIYGWTTGMIIGAVILGVSLVLTLVFMKEPERWFEVKAEQAKNPVSVFKEMKEIYLNRNVFAACMFIIPVWGIFSTAAYWVPSALMEDAGWGEATSGLVGSFFSCAGMLAFIFGILSDRWGKRKPLTMIAGVGMAISFLILTICFVSGQYILVAVTLVLSGFFAYCGLLLVYYLVSDAIGGIKSAAANGLIMAVGYLVGGFVYPIGVGYFLDITGSYAVGFIAITVTAVVFGVIGIIPSKDTPKDVRPDEVEDNGGIS